MEFRNGIRAAKSQLINFFEPKTKTESSSRVKDLKKLDELVDGKNDPLSQAVNKCRGMISKLLDCQISQKDYDEVNRSQEHLFKKKGSHVHSQFSAFQRYLKNKGSEYDPLKKELDSYIPMGPSRNMKEGVKKLKAGESIIIDAQSCNPVGKAKVMKSGHAMVMRITHNADGSYKMEFANTGLGIHNKSFHPQSLSEPYKCQTIACINNIPSKKLLGNNFFETYYSISNGAVIPAKSCLEAELRRQANSLLEPKEDLHESIKTRLDALYLCLGTLGEPEKVIDENSNYYSRPQIGGSCSVSGLWAISKIILPKDCIAEMEHDVKLKSLLRNYKLIENGYDQSSTRKIMVLDQVESLRHIYKGDEHVLKQLQKIETKLKRNLGVDRVESKVSGGIQLNDKLSKKSSAGEFSMPSMRGKLTPQKGKLKLDVKWEAETSEDSPIQYSMVEDSPNHFIGKDRLDSEFLLYFAVANGDQKSCEGCIKQILSQSPVNHSPDKIYDIQLCLVNLIDDLSSSNTRSDIAKKYFLGLLMESNNPNYNMGEALKLKYVAMDVEAHLTTDNIWVNGINELMARKEDGFQKQLAELGTPEAVYDAAMKMDRYYDRVQFRKLLKVAADLGHVESQYELGSDYWVKREFEEAVKYLRMAADQGHVIAQFKMGAAYDRGALDIETSIKYSQMAADQGHENSKNQLDRLKLRRDELNDSQSI